MVVHVKVSPILATLWRTPRDPLALKWISAMHLAHPLDQEILVQLWHRLIGLVLVIAI